MDVPASRSADEEVESARADFGGRHDARAEGVRWNASAKVSGRLVPEDRSL